MGMLLSTPEISIKVKEVLGVNQVIVLEITYRDTDGPYYIGEPRIKVFNLVVGESVVI